MAGVVAEGSRMTRRSLLVAGGATLAGLVLPVGDSRAARSLGGLISVASAPRVPVFHSRPDLRIPALTVNGVPGRRSLRG
jgi:hypothetical protein